MSMSEANKPGQDVPEEERVVLCGANAYDKKYYFNELEETIFLLNTINESLVKIFKQQKEEHQLIW